MVMLPSKEIFYLYFFIRISKKRVEVIRTTDNFTAFALVNTVIIANSVSK